MAGRDPAFDPLRKDPYRGASHGRAFTSSSPSRAIHGCTILRRRSRRRSIKWTLGFNLRWPNCSPNPARTGRSSGNSFSPDGSGGRWSTTPGLPPCASRTGSRISGRPTGTSAAFPLSRHAIRSSTEPHIGAPPLPGSCAGHPPCTLQAPNRQVPDPSRDPLLRRIQRSSSRHRCASSAPSKCPPDRGHFMDRIRTPFRHDVRPGGYGDFDFSVVDTSSPKGQVSPKSGQLQPTVLSGGRSGDEARRRRPAVAPPGPGLGVRGLHHTYWTYWTNSPS